MPQRPASSAVVRRDESEVWKKQGCNSMGGSQVVAITRIRDVEITGRILFSLKQIPQFIQIPGIQNVFLLQPSAAGLPDTESHQVKVGYAMRIG